MEGFRFSLRVDGLEKGVGLDREDSREGVDVEVERSS